MLNAKSIGIKIAEARKQLNISQAQLAQQLFISSQAIGKWERGESMPDILTFNRLADILRVDMNYFSDAAMPAPAEAPAAAIQPAQPAPAQPNQKPEWDMSRGNWVDADFSGLKNLHEKFSYANMQRCKFLGSDLSGLLLKSNHVSHCDFSGSALNGSHFQQSHIEHDQFRDCSLEEARFTGSHVKDCDLTGADLTGAKFSTSALQKSNLENAVLFRTNFHRTDLTDLVFTGTVEDCAFEESSFSKVTFQNATLINTFFKCRSLKNIRFVDCRADRITLEFLKNGKADVSGIALITA